MKKILCLMLALMMVMSFSAFAEDGTFTGVGEGGKAGNVSVEVTVEGGAKRPRAWATWPWRI